jgi:putative glycosyltransferase (TIGR04372 family)
MKLSTRSFWRRQFYQIRKGDLETVFGKVVKLLRITLTILVVIMIRLVRPLIVVRVGTVDVGRLGGIYQGDWYLSEKADGKYQSRYLDVFYFTKSTGHVNKQWLKMWRQALPSVPGTELWKHVLRLNRLLPRYEKHEISNHNVYPDLRKWQTHLADPSSGRINIYNKRLKSVLKNNKVNISFSLEEEEIGRSALEKLGVPKGKQYICFHARDSAYLDAVYNKRDWSYHDYRDSSIQNYVPTAEEMVNRGYYALRMGAIVKDLIHCSNPQVIDYASSGQRTDFNDIYIGSHCRFFLCSDGGMSAIPEMFRIPTVYVNWTSILRISMWVLNGLFIFKKIYFKNENRFMSFLEIMNLGFGGRDTNDVFAELGLEVIENTPEEIRAVTIEMDERLNGTWKTTEEDEELQQRFWALFGPEKLRSPDLRIGANFLRDNKDLL